MNNFVFEPPSRLSDLRPAGDVGHGQQQGAGVHVQLPEGPPEGGGAALLPPGGGTFAHNTDPLWRPVSRSLVFLGLKNTFFMNHEPSPLMKLP